LAAEQAKQAAEQAMKNLRSGQVFKDCPDCPELVVVTAGTFNMGGDYSNNSPVHRVAVQTFSIGRTEVTQGQWRSLMGSNPSHFKDCGESCPVEKINVQEAKEFLKRLSLKTKKRYRLPTEAEWEFACLAQGKHDKYCGIGDLNAIAWWAFNYGNSGKVTHPVAQLEPNAIGIFDMTGNVAEWVEDCDNSNYRGAPVDGTAWTTGNCGSRVVRGGGAYWVDIGLEGKYRHSTFSGTRDGFIGFRAVREIP
jgi:formylglycine-generating enzyme required for sulfatase activity